MSISSIGQMLINLFSLCMEPSVKLTTNPSWWFLWMVYFPGGRTLYLDTWNCAQRASC